MVPFNTEIIKIFVIRHATTLARRAPAFHTPAQKPPHLCEEDEESDDDDDEARNLQAHVVLKHMYM